MVPSHSTRSLLALCVALAVTVVAVLLTHMDRVVWHHGDLILCLYGVLLSLLLPRRWAIALLLGFAASYALVRQISVVKIALTQMPLTMLDLKIAIANPAGFITSVGLPEWTTTAVGLVGVGMACIVAGAFHRLLLFSRARPKDGVMSFMAAAGIVLLAVVAASAKTDLIAGKVNRQEFAKLWKPDQLASLSSNVGVLTFLIYSSTLEQHDRAVFFTRSLAEPLSRSEVNGAVGKYVSWPTTRASMVPNILLVHLESTFNPNTAFILAAPVVSPLLQPQEFTRLTGPLRVNTIGGGSWITEFEVLTGLDSRLFGYSGHYTHSSLAPYVTGAFPAYLRFRGYRTIAYYSSPGRFYSARFAFARYGFETFVGSDELGVPNPLDGAGLTGAEQIDQKTAEAAIRRMQGEASDRPLFAFVGFLDNHGPHPCLHFNSSDQFSTTYRNTEDFTLNCALNEYVRRLGSTARAFARLRTFLEERQSKTGRPFVILGYGDHQPYSFTAKVSSGDNGGALRTSASLNETAFILESSIPGVVRCCLRGPIPATLIPSLLSAYVAEDEENLYLPVSFSLLDRCGPDFLAQNVPFVSTAKNDRSTSPAPRCGDTVERALAVMQHAGIFQR